MKKAVVFTILIMLTNTLFSLDFYNSLKVDEQMDVTVVINPENLSIVYEDSDAYVFWEPESDVRQSTYEVFYIPMDNFKKMIGDPNNLKRSVKCDLKIQRLQDRVFTPDDPMMQSPDGGIRTVQYVGVVLRVK